MVGLWQVDLKQWPWLEYWAMANEMQMWTAHTPLGIILMRALGGAVRSKTIAQRMRGMLMCPPLTRAASILRCHTLVVRS